MWPSWADQSTLSYKGFFGRPRMSEFNWTLITHQFSQWDGSGVWLVGEPELDSLQSEALFFLFGLLSLTPIIPSPLQPTVFHLKYSIFESCFYFLKCLRCVPLFGLVHGSWRSWLQSEIAPQYLASMLLSHSSSILFTAAPLQIFTGINGVWPGLWNEKNIKYHKYFPNIISLFWISYLSIFLIHFFFFLQLNL